MNDEQDLIFWSHPTAPGIKVEEIFGGKKYSPKIWKNLALQIFCEQGKDNYREILHFRNGAPIIKDFDCRVSFSHTNGLLVAAFLPPTPEINLSLFSPLTAMGIDAEKLDRKQVLRVREKFLSDKEISLIPEDDLTANIIAWTAKEALLKAAMDKEINYRENITLIRLPGLYNSPMPAKEDLKEYGKAIIRIDSDNSTNEVSFSIFSYESEGYCITLAWADDSIRFGHEQNKSNPNA